MELLSEHFLLSEAEVSSTAQRLGIDNSIPPHLLSNVRITALGAEQVRSCLAGHAMRIDSWFRCADLNEAVGGAIGSAHLKGFAIDFTCPAFGTPADCVISISASDILFDQIIQEGTWVHVSFAPAMRRQVLTAIFKAGQKVTYVSGTAADET